MPSVHIASFDFCYRNNDALGTLASDPQNKYSQGQTRLKPGTQSRRPKAFSDAMIVWLPKAAQGVSSVGEGTPQSEDKVSKDGTLSSDWGVKSGKIKSGDEK